MSLRVLYVSYDGLLEPIGQAQVLPYLEGLSRQGVEFVLLTFEKSGDVTPTSVTCERTRSRLAKGGIRWVSLRYHKRPALLSTLYDIVRGAMWVLFLARRHRMEIIHARSYVPAVMALPARWLLQRPFLFDIRGFWVEERVEGGIWRRGLVYGIAKRVEQFLYRSADAVVSLTEAGKEVVKVIPAVARRGIPIVVIPTCVDTDQFAPRPPDLALQKECVRGTVFVYIGSTGTWAAIEEVLDFFAAIRGEIVDSSLLLLVRGLESPIQVALQRRGLTSASLVVPSVPHDQIPRWLSMSRVGLAFYRRGESNQARYPTKIGEYLASGLPVVVSGGVGDCDDLIEKERVGVIVREYTPEEYRRAVRALCELLQDSHVSDRCRQVALTHLSLSGGVMRYYALYRRLTRGGTSKIAAEGGRG